MKPSALLARARSRRRFDTPVASAGWSAPSGRPRVLIENSDRAVLWGYGESLRAAGYEVATCSGPSGDGRSRVRCPLLEGDPCPLVSGADVVLSTCELARSRDLLAALASDKRRAVVFEVPVPAAADYRHAAGSTTFLPVPVTQSDLLQAVAEALEAGAVAAA